MTLWNIALIFIIICLSQLQAAEKQVQSSEKKVVATKSSAIKKSPQKVSRNKKNTAPVKKKSNEVVRQKHISKPKPATPMPLPPADNPAQNLAKKSDSTEVTNDAAQHADQVAPALSPSPNKLHKPEYFAAMPGNDKSALPETQKTSEEDRGNNDENDEEESSDDQKATNDAKVVRTGKKIMIRVLLKEMPTDQKVTFTIQSSKGFILESPIASGKRARWKHEILNLLANDGNLFLLTAQGVYKRIKTGEITIASADGNLKIDNNRYCGTVYLRIDPKTKNVQMVNKVDLDDYIYAVLRYESLSYWPLEMHKVQAIASRSYAVRQIKIARNNTHSLPFYDIKNYNVHQVYNGDHDSFHLREAVEETHNLVLTYKGAIALTMFDICCGGIIQSCMKKKDADKPYLFRKTKCTYCTGKASYEWRHTINKEKFLQNLLDKPNLTNKAKKIGKIVGISIKDKDRAGIVHRVLVHGSKNNISFTNNEFKSALDGKAKSNAYSVKKLNDSITVHGYGFGHNMGLCQIGARELVAKGWDYQEILDFYFPKTKMMRLKVI